jgi:hypothetical protein
MRRITTTTVQAEIIFIMFIGRAGKPNMAERRMTIITPIRGPTPTHTAGNNLIGSMKTIDLIGKIAERQGILRSQSSGMIITRGTGPALSAQHLQAAALIRDNLEDQEITIAGSMKIADLVKANTEDRAMPNSKGAGTATASNTGIAGMAAHISTAATNSGLNSAFISNRPG